MVPYCFYHLFSVYQKASGQYKAQLGCFVLATIFGFVGGGSTFLLVYKISFGIELIYLMPFYPIFMGIGLVQHGLFDVQKIVNSFHREKLAAIGTLAASVNHEIKSPLYVIQGVSQSFLVGWQEGGCREPEKSIQCAVEALKKVMAQSSRALDIIRKFSNFAKRDVSEAPQLSAVSLKMTYENVLPLVQHELALDKINIESRIPENLPQARVDERHLEEILFNLIVNACHALKLKGGGNIVISGGQGEGKLGLTIEDNGPGISKENLNKIFEPFYTTKSEGTGLGLYITKQLVERNGGNISVVSRPGMGTIFQLRFKL
jgi:two-component system NtrC family sensor kinase